MRMGTKRQPPLGSANYESPQSPPNPSSGSEPPATPPLEPQPPESLPLCGQWQAANQSVEKSEALQLFICRSSRGRGQGFFYYALVYCGSNGLRVNVCSFQRALLGPGFNQLGFLGLRSDQCSTRTPVHFCLRPPSKRTKPQPQAQPDRLMANSQSLSSSVGARITIKAGVCLFPESCRTRPKETGDADDGGGRGPENAVKNAEKAKLFNDVKYKVFCLVAGASNLSKL